MQNYKKSKKFKEKLEICILGLKENTNTLVVTPATSVHEVLPSALESLKKDGQILWIGSGPSADKAVECVEATKNRFKGLYQVTQIMSKRLEEYWEPIKEGLTTLQVVVEVPTIALLLSVSDPYKSSNESDIIYGERSFSDGFEP